jgi:hypothetical protein
MKHPRDKHRMRPVDGADHVWFCNRHSIYAQLVDTETAESVARGDEWTHYEALEGVVVRHGDERQGGQVVYFREK